MILRNIAGALKRQDWATVVIEFLLVVAGIMVALQADDWAQEREDRRKEQMALERLFTEAQAAVEYLDEQLERYQGWVDGAETAITAFHGPRTPEAENLMQAHIFNLNYYPPLVVQRVVFDELSASGGMELIRSDSVRREIALYYAYISFVEVQNGAWQNFIANIDRSPWASSVTATFSPEQQSRMRVTYDWDALWNNAAYKSYVVQSLRDAIVFQTYRNRLYGRAVTMCRSLAEATKNTCNVKREPEVES